MTLMIKAELSMNLEFIVKLLLSVQIQFPDRARDFPQRLVVIP